mmetsp:Transcript_45099/g.98034  ORF Transcript_45099/g.98034 Transcript_45099/m.98034 type:complete len:114 (+) Transcript_45099:493-834(+)
MPTVKSDSEELVAIDAHMRRERFFRHGRAKVTQPPISLPFAIRQGNDDQLVCGAAATLSNKQVQCTRRSVWIDARSKTSNVAKIEPTARLSIRGFFEMKHLEPKHFAVSESPI